MRVILQQILQECGLPAWLVPDYLLMLTGAIVVGSLTALGFCQRRGIPTETAQDLLFWGILASLLGSKVFYVLQFGWLHDSWTSLLFQGFALYGGLFGLLAAWLVYYRLRRFAVGAFLDCTAPALALGLALGRVGCFMAGCDGGRVSSRPWAIAFPWGTDAFEFQVMEGLINPQAGLSLPAHPTQLYEMGFGLLLFGVAWGLLNRQLQPGAVFLITVMSYGVYRFATEPLRVDLGGVHPLGLTFASLLSLLAILGGSLVWPLLEEKRRGRRSSSSRWEPPQSRRLVDRV